MNNSGRDNSSVISFTLVMDVSFVMSMFWYLVAWSEAISFRNYLKIKKSYNTWAIIFTPWPVSDAKSSAPLPKDDDDLFASVPAVKTKKKKETKKVEVSRNMLTFMKFAIS